MTSKKQVLDKIAAAERSIRQKNSVGALTNLSAARELVAGLREPLASPLPDPAKWLPVVDPALWEPRRIDFISAGPEALKPLWGRLDMVDNSRLGLFTTGGPEGGPYRNLCANKGDEELWDNNCRAELGLNDWEGKVRGSWGEDTYCLFRPGEHCLTAFSLRFPKGFLIDDSNWKTIWQQKNTQPCWDAPTGPALEMQVRSGRLRPMASWTDLPFAPAVKNDVWYHVWWEAVYSADPAVGFVRMTVFEKGADTADSGIMPVATLKRQTAAPASIPANDSRRTIPVGSEIPDHQRIGDYHNPILPQMSGVDSGAVNIYTRR